MLPVSRKFLHQNMYLHGSIKKYIQPPRILFVKAESPRPVWQQNPLECNVDSSKYSRQIYSLIYAATMATKGDQRIFSFANAASKQGRTTQTSKEGAQLKFLYLHQFEV